MLNSFLQQKSLISFKTAFQYIISLHKLIYKYETPDPFIGNGIAVIISTVGSDDRQLLMATDNR